MANDTTTRDATAAAADSLQVFQSETLAAAATGQIDLNDLARRELAQRGLNSAGVWVGNRGDRLVCAVLARELGPESDAVASANAMAGAAHPEREEGVN
mgnify:FL=1|jgi:hypothetical protein